MVTADALSISDAAQLTGLSAHTLRYYERAGLMLDPVERAPSTHRRYTEAELVRAGEGNEAERLALLEAHREAVLEQLDAIRRNLEAIDYKIEIYRDCVDC